MATLELSTLSDHLDDEEIAAVLAAVEEAAATNLNIAEDGTSTILERDIDDDVFVDFLDRLDANDVGAKIYLPAEFEDVIEIGESRFGSAHALIIVLDNLREDFLIGDTEDGEEDEEEEEEEAETAAEYELDDEDEPSSFGDDDSVIEMKDGQLRHIWRALYRGAQNCVQNGLCLFIHD